MKAVPRYESIASPGGFGTVVSGATKKIFGILVSVAVALSVAAVAVPAAMADTAPVDPANPATPLTVSADALPTVQIDGIVWQQAIIGNTAYAVGQFTTARPAGSAPGTNTVARNNILAYDLTTGNLINSFTASLNGMAKTIVASPDGTRLYVGGAFSQVNGVARPYVAALTPSTGALISSWAPKVNSRVVAITASNDKVYMGGWFSGVGSVSRTKLAAVTAANATLLPWNPVPAGGDINTMLLSPDSSKVVVGGSFTTLNGSSDPGYGLGALDTLNGGLLPWAANGLIRNGGAKASILSLSSDGPNIYGTGYVFGAGGNLEGTFSADWATGSIKWVEDCHGDTYGVYAAETAVYTVSHAHYCGNIGAFPQTSPTWTFHHALAFSKAATGTITNDPYGYYNFAGTPDPSLLQWYPDLEVGTFTGQSQAAWNVTGNSDYVILGGEFPKVNGKAQQGIVRFAKKDIAPNKEGPQINGSAANPSVASLSSGTARVSWTANWDKDNQNLTYQLVRDGKTATPVYTTTKLSNFWQRSAMGYLDTGLMPGSTHTYQVVAVDPFGNTSKSQAVSVTVAATGSLSAYAQGVLQDGASAYWRLGEPSGSTAIDWAGWSDAALGSGVTRGAAGAVIGDSNTASSFNGTNAGYGATQTIVQGPDTFTTEAWFKTTSNRGGKIIGFGNSATGDSGSYDRHVYMDNSGKLIFGVYTGNTQTLQSASNYNDGQWHQVVASMGSNGMSLYIDGKRIGQRADVTSGQSYSGGWRIGGDNLNGWPSQPASSYFSGDLDEVAVYPTVLSLSQVQNHYQASGRTLNLPVAPADNYGKAVFQAEPDLYWRLGESTGNTANDSGIAGNSGTYIAGVTLGRPGAIAGTSNTAVQFNGSAGLLSGNARVSNPTVYSEELWFNTTTTNGGKLIGFGDSQMGLSSNYDRHVYMENSGQLTFGVYTGQTNTTTSTASYNDGAWHHMVATQSAEGMKLYVDGQLVGSNPQTAAQPYDGYWRVGSDNTWGPQPYFAGTIDEVAVYPTALSASAVADHFALGAGRVANQPPVAAFASSAVNLVASFDGSGSSDPDGSVVSYGWDFGDGSVAGTGVSLSHTYAAAGTYSVKLVVTDDKGATNAVTHGVTVSAAPPVNQPPVAAFASSSVNLVASFDGSGSSDPDGSVVSYGWDFGDGSVAGTGVSPSHTYAAAGTYSVKLVVTDDKGATNAVTHGVTVSAAPPVNQPLAQDDFNRTSTNGFGTATVGGAWTVPSGSSNFAVSPGAGTVSSAVGQTRYAYLNGVSSSSAETRVQVALDRIGDGGGSYFSILGRRVGTADYRVSMWISKSGAMTMTLAKTDGGIETTIASQALPGMYVAGDLLQIRFQVFGISPTTLNAKVWRAVDTEPTAWQLTSLDSTTGLQSAGGVGLRTYISGSNTNGPVRVAFRNWLTTPMN
ncbi:LamG-like jellyroll fold domain-containing protein [Arthrobacter sp. H14-L1]|uniref:LamG-like jellyroll fold domain-containing protein n=1 Tax=Arthrobacter sp. H14-L1 TaxID=2996697 RepID=UPI0022702EDA|nr:LamG-like jellyroll fold domain-containing protein [Arthrobacter sp. H14-L1]MCY0904971.1 PKD domain-containing protein [Arthrobacter sp. H14-L1]